MFIRYRLTLAKRAVDNTEDLAYEQIVSAIRLHQDSLRYSIINCRMIYYF